MRKITARALASLLCVFLLIAGASFFVSAEADDPEAPADAEAVGFLLGDTDGDDRVSAMDARVLLRVSASLESLPDETLPYGDLDRDGVVNALDARLALRCSASLEPLPARHEYSVAVEREAACKEPGALTFSCALCGETGEMVIPARGHRYETTALTEATCTEPGSKEETCSVCGETTTLTLSAKGHSYEVTKLTEATCTEPGVREETCAECGNTVAETLPAPGHDWVEATPDAAKHCARCGEKVAGWAYSDGRTYFLNADDTRAKGWTDIDGAYCYFDGDGVFVKAFKDGLIYTASSGGLSGEGRAPKVAVIGDSIVASIANYDAAEDFDLYGKISLHVDTVDSKKISGSQRTVLREAEGRDYDVVILLLGVNDLTYDTAAWGEMYRGVLEKLKTIVPDAVIYAHAILPINDRKTGSGEKMWRVTAKNEEIKRSAEAEGVRFLDIPPGMTDENGQLPYDAAGDGVHFGPTYCRIWYDWTKAQLK